MPVADHLASVQRVLRGVASGSEATRLLHDALVGAVRATRGSQGLLVGVMDGAPVPLATTGTVARVVVDAAEQAVSSGRLVRRRATDGVLSALAEPLRVGQRVVGALASGGDGRTLDPALLPLFADAAALALTRRTSSATTSVPGALDAVAGAANEVDRVSVLVGIFDAAEHLLGTVAGFCAVAEGDGLRVAHCRGVDVERVRRASQHPEFRALLTTPSLRVDPPSHPVVAQLVDGAECAVGLPLLVGNRRLGHLLLLVGDAPDDGTQALLRAFARHAALALRTADLYRRLGDTEDQLTSVVQSIPEPVLVVDDAGRLSLVNSAAAELFSLAGSFEAGRPVAGRLGHPALEALLTGGPEDEVEVTLGRPPRVYRASARAVRSGEGRSLGRVLLLADLTRERTEDHVEAGLVSAMGHGLRAPLASLQEQVRELASGVSEDEAVDRAVRSVERGIGRLDRLVADLLVVASPDEPARPLHLEDADLADVVAELAQAAGERVSLRVPREPVDIRLDRAKVEQVVLRLLDNALVHTEDRVEVVVAVEGDEAVVRVVDHGPGIYSGDIPFLFERSRPHGGVGLYICRRLTELHGGRIWCESRLGGGSTFSFALPRSRDRELVRR